MSRIKNLKYSNTEITDQVAGTVDSFLKSHQPVALGPAYSTMDPRDVDLNLQLFRASKKWEIPSAANSETRRTLTIQNMLKSDSEGLTQFDLGSCAYTRRQLNRMRFNLRKHVERHYRFKTERLRMPKGETLVSASGDVSIVAKLRDASQWCVTPDAFEIAAEVIYNTPALKRCAKLHFIPYSRRDIRRLSISFLGMENPGLEIFKCRLMDFVTIVPGMRLETVPKDNEKDRAIACEPLLNMIAQSVVEEGIRHLIKVVYGIDLNTSQELHAFLISDELNATLDFKNASNSSWMCFLEWCLKGTDLYEHIIATRSPVAIFDGIEYPLNMVAPMGNGFTFGYMTLVILSCAREYDSFSHVFGDDLVIDKHVAPQCLQALQLIGYEVNVTKSFVEGTFKESCGAFWSFDHYVLSYEFEYPVDIIDAIVLTNKVGILAQECGSIWVDLHKRLLRLFPAYFYSWCEWHATDVKSESVLEVPWGSHRVVDLDDLVVCPDGIKRRLPPSPAPKFDITSSSVIVYTRGDMRKKRTCSTSRDLWQRKVAASQDDLQKIQLHPKEVSLRVVFEYQKDTYRRVPQENVTPPWIAYYMMSGRCLAPTRRVSKPKRRVVAHSELISYWYNTRTTTEMAS